MRERSTSGHEHSRTTAPVRASVIRGEIGSRLQNPSELQKQYNALDSDTRATVDHLAKTLAQGDLAIVEKITCALLVARAITREQIDATELLFREIETVLSLSGGDDASVG